MRGRERRDRLARIALQATGGVEPRRAPFYVQPGDVDDAPWQKAPGWYWQAPDAPFPTYLAYSSARAEVELLMLLARQREGAS